MKKLALMFALVVPMAACGGGAAGEVMKKMKDSKDKVCACKDEACVEAVKKDVEAWVEKNASKLKDFKPSKSQMEALDKIDEEIDKCEEKFEKKAEPIRFRPRRRLIPPRARRLRPTRPRARRLRPIRPQARRLRRRRPLPPRSDRRRRSPRRPSSRPIVSFRPSIIAAIRP